MKHAQIPKNPIYFINSSTVHRVFLNSNFSHSLSCPSFASRRQKRKWELLPKLSQLPPDTTAQGRENTSPLPATTVTSLNVLWMEQSLWRSLKYILLHKHSRNFWKLFLPVDWRELGVWMTTVPAVNSRSVVFGFKRVTWRRSSPIERRRLPNPWKSLPSQS